MSYYVISYKQLLSSVTMIAVFLSAAAAVTVALLNHLDQPEVYRDRTGKCVKVINYRNGDGYGCQDVDITLRKYTVIHVDPQS